MRTEPGVAPLNTVIMNDRFVAFFDILGFKELVRRQPLADLVAKFRNIYDAVGDATIAYESTRAEVISVLNIADRQDWMVAADPTAVRQEFARSTKLRLLLMSDSVVIYSEPVGRGDENFTRHLSSILRVGRVIVARLLAAGLPTRGAISHGEFYANETDQVFVGKALVEAYELAESQEWIGAAVAPSLAADVATMYRTFRSADLKNRRWLAVADWEYLPFDVPIKRPLPMSAGGWETLKRKIVRWVMPSQSRLLPHTKPFYVLNWATSSSVGNVSQSRFFVDGLAADTKIAIKYQNTAIFIERGWSDGTRGLALR